MQKKLLSLLPKILSALLVVGLVLSYFFIPEAKAFFNEAWAVLSSGDEQRIHSWVEGFGWAGPLILIAAMIAQMFLIVIPSVVLMVVCILAYGPIWGSLLVLVSIVSASSIGYLLGNLLGEGLITSLVGSKTESKLEDFIEEFGFWAIAITRLNPFLSNDAISFVGGILGMNYFKFIGATIAGIAPLTLFIAIMGESTDSLKSRMLWGSLVSLVIFIFYVWWSKRKRNN